jgi:hypothetical protein
VLRKVFGSGRKEMAEGWGRLHNEELNGFVPLAKFYDI